MNCGCLMYFFFFKRSCSVYSIGLKENVTLWTQVIIWIDIECVPRQWMNDKFVINFKNAWSDSSLVKF